jgi:hypothetical protein
VYRPGGLGLDVIGSSAKKSLEGDLADGAGLCGTVGASPVISGCIEWPEGGGDRLAADILEVGMGRGGPAVEDILLVRGGGGVGCAAGMVGLGAARFRVVTISSGIS